MDSVNWSGLWDWIVGFVAEFDWIARIIGVIIAGVIATWLVRRLVQRVVQRVVTGVKKSQGVEDTQALQASPIEAMRQVQRTRTLGTVLNNFSQWAIGTIVVITVLSELGVSVTALIASAGILGAALGFGAQSLVKDMLNGLFMVFEDQLGVGDVVDLGEATGVVEHVGIRVTQVRDVNGTMWFIRNGEILRVGNHSQDWARVIVDMPIPYTEDVDDAQNALLEAAKAFAASPEWRRKVLEEPEIWGIESISREALVVRLVVKVRAGEQWVVRRALNRYIKVTLDSRGIDIPALNRMVLDEGLSRLERTRPLRPSATTPTTHDDE